MRRDGLRRCAAVALGVALVANGSSAAALDFGLRGGIEIESSDRFAGLELVVRLPHSRWHLSPNVEVVLRQGRDTVLVNADAVYELPGRRPVDLWIGLGAALESGGAVAGGGTTTAAGVNLLGGLELNPLGIVRPYFQAKLLLAEEERLLIGVGLRF